jgi:hypothetical protein
MWLHSKDFEKDVFQRWRTSPLRDSPTEHLFIYSHHIASKEKSLCRTLKEYGYERGFWIWAGSYLGEDPADVLDRGDSLAEAVRDRLN